MRDGACYTRGMSNLRRPERSTRPVLAWMCVSAAMLMLPALAQGVASPAAAAHDPNTSMLPDAPGAVPWSVLSAATIRMHQGKLGPAFPQTLRPLQGKIVKLQGYILPIEAGLTHSYFLLSAWSPSCPFCLTAGPEAMVEVRARTAVKYSIDPVVVEGRLLLLDNDPSGVFYRLVEAVPASLK